MQRKWFIACFMAVSMVGSGVPSYGEIEEIPSHQGPNLPELMPNLNLQKVVDQLNQLFAGNFGAVGEDNPADRNNDGIVDLFDVVIAQKEFANERSDQEQQPVRQEISKMSKTESVELRQGIQAWFNGGRINKRGQENKTGLRQSFEPNPVDSDLPFENLLRDVVFTYDAALDSLVNTSQGDQKNAGKPLEFFAERRTTEGPGLNTAYSVSSGRETLERRDHLGPQAVQGIAAYWHGVMFNTNEFDEYLQDTAIWAQNLPHDEAGGVYMGTYGGWDRIMSTENIEVDYMLQTFAASQQTDVSLRDKMLQERAGLRDWIKTEGHDGKWQGKNSSVNALDTRTMLLLMGPKTLLGSVEEGGFGYTEKEVLEMFEEVEQLFMVEGPEPGTILFDWTDEANAAAARGQDREGNVPRLKDIEGAGQMAVAYKTWRDHFASKGNKTIEGTHQTGASIAQRYDSQANASIAGMKFYVINVDKSNVAGATHGVVALPNTGEDKPMASGFGWLKRTQYEPAINGSAWFHFAIGGPKGKDYFNPYNLDSVYDKLARFQRNLAH